MTLTDEMLVEKVARAICAAANDCTDVKCEACEIGWPKYLPEARAALTVIVTEVEEAAKGAERLRRERNALFELTKGSPAIMAAYERLRECVTVNLWWGPEGTPESVALEVVKSLEAISKGECEPSFPATNKQAVDVRSLSPLQDTKAKDE